MRAVNLVPADERKGAGGAGGRSGGAVYVLLGVLGLMVVVVALTTRAKAANADKIAQAATLEAQATQAEGRAASLTSYAQFSTLRATRTQTVSSLAASRFDWSHALGEIARVIPANVSLDSLVGTVTPGVGLKGGAAGTAGTLRSVLAVPAIELAGCTTDQDSVARMLTRMRLIDGVTRVSLQSSEKSDATTDAPAGGGSVGTVGCSRGTPGAAPDFSLVVFFDQVAGSVPTTASGAKRVAVAQLTPAGATGAAGAAAPAGATP